MRYLLMLICKLFGIAYGLLAGLVGMAAILTAVALTFAATAENSELDQTASFLLYLAMLMMADIAAFFGLASVLYGLRYTFGPVPWMVKIHSYFWANAMRNMFLMMGILMVFGMILGLVQKFSG